MAKSSQLRSVFAWALLVTLATAIVALFVNVQLAFFVLLFAAVGWWAWENPEGGFLLFVVVAPLLSLFKATQTIGTVTLIKDVIILALFLRVVVTALLAKKLPYRRSLLFGPAAALAAWTAFETLRADSLALGILRARDIILYLLLYFIVLYLPTGQAGLPATKEIWMRRLQWFTLSFLITAIHAAYQWFWAADSAVLRFDPGRQVWIPRISSTFGHPSVYGEFGVVAAALFMSCALFLKKKLLWIFLVFISLPLVYLTYSRAVWIGFLVTGVGIGGIWLWKRGNLKYWALPVATAAIISFMILFLTLPQGRSLLSTTLDPNYASNRIRLEFVARLVAPMSSLDAIIGRGLGDVVQQKLLQTDVGVTEIAGGASRDVQLAKDATLVDNQYLKSFVEMGVIGLVIYVWLFWQFMKGCLELMRISPHVHIGSVQRVIGLWGLGFLVAFVVQALFIDMWDVFPMNAMFWIVGGLVSVALTPDTKTLV